MFHNAKRRRPLIGVALLALLPLAAILTTGPAARGQTKKTDSNNVTLSISLQAAPYTVNSNPFSAGDPMLSGILGTISFIYEPLLQFNYLRSSQVTPWLATSYSWSNGGKTLTFAIRHNVHWSNGSLFTANDVAYTFNLLKKYPALNLNGVVFSSAKALNEWTVQITQATPNYSNLFYIASQMIVPQAVWSKVKNPVTYLDLHPVGTGPYLLSSMNAQNITLVRNNHYWGPEPAVTTIQIPGFDTTASAVASMQQNQTQWGGNFLGNVRAYTGSGNGTHIIWNPPYADVFLVPNMTRYPLNIPAFRQALNYVFNRPEFARNADLGEEGAIMSPTGFVLPRDESFVPAKDRGLKFSVNLARAKSILLAAHFSYRNGSLYAPNGKQVSLSVTVPSDFADWLAGTPTLVQNLQAIGIQASLDSPAFAAFQSDLSTGNFSLILWSQFSTGPGPFYQFDQFLDSAFSAPIGQTAASNYGRWDNAATDAALKQYADSNSPAVQQQAMNTIANIMVNDVPLFPLEYQVAWGQVETAQFSGWPSASNPYATDCPYLAPSNEFVILKLKPKG